MKIKKNDFIEIDYVGRIKETKQIFDLTDEKAAKENNLFDPEREYKPIIICIGEKNILKGIDCQLEDKEIGNEYEIIVKPEDAFGKRDPKLMKLVNANIFKKSDIMPMPGLQVNIDGMLGTIRTFSGGRVIVDFNHPLAEKELVYKIKILRKVTDSKEKLEACMKFMNLKENLFSVKINKEKALISLKMPIKQEFKKLLEKKILELVPEIKELKIDSEKDTKKINNMQSID